MSLLNNIFKTLFGNNNKKSGTAGNSNFMNWGEQRKNEIAEDEAKIKEWLPASIRENGNTKFSWESGGDEAFLTVENVGEFEDRVEALEDYLIRTIDIPSAGDFTMNGNGIIYIEANWVKAKYKSTFKEIIDFDEEIETEVFNEEIMEEDEINLFSI